MDGAGDSPEWADDGGMGHLLDEFEPRQEDYFAMPSPYDPLRGPADLYGYTPSPMLGALERSIEGSLEPPARFTEPDAFYMDEVGLMTEALEAKIEQTVIPPPEVFEPPVRAAPEPAPRPPLGPAPPGPPLTREPERLPWVAMQAPLAARPYYARGGLGPPASESRGGGAAGRYRNSYSTSVRVCPESHDPVDEAEDCPKCPSFGDWAGDGTKRCCHDWQEEEGADEKEEV